MKTFVHISTFDRKKRYIEDVSIYVKDCWDSNPKHNEDKNEDDAAFERWKRSIEVRSDDLWLFNTRDENAHFIFGWFESYCQSEDVCPWVLNEDLLYILVQNTW